MSDSPGAHAVRLFLFSGARKSTWKFLSCFGALRMALPKVKNLHFARALGCGQGIGFSFWPDFQRYAVLVVGTEDALDSFETHPQLQALGREARQLEIYELLPVRGHGKWDGEVPFEQSDPAMNDAPIAVITRARVPVRAVPAFIRHSNQVTATLAAATGRVFSIGMGEVPLIRQATFSVWTDAAAMEDFAYGSPRHRAAMQATRRDSLFSEELFWRFAVLSYTMRPLK